MNGRLNEGRRGSNEPAKRRNLLFKTLPQCVCVLKKCFCICVRVRTCVCVSMQLCFLSISVYVQACACLVCGSGDNRWEACHVLVNKSVIVLFCPA